MKAKVNNNESGNMEVMNQVIVRLNELKSVKMASISKSKRPAAKFNKEVAIYLLDNWDNLEQLKTCQLQMRRNMPHTTCTEIMGMYDARVAELQAELDKANEPEKPAETKADDKPKAKAKIDSTTKTAKSDKSAKKQSQEKSDNTKKRPGAPKTLKVGDRHKNGKWIWTEYEPGKFDWRTDPAIKAKNAAERAAKSTASKSTTDAGKAKSKAQKKAKAASNTKKAAEPKKAPAITIEEMLSRQAPSGLSKAQKNALGLLKKGYRLITIGTAVFLQKDDDRKSIEVTTVNALIERYKLDAEPIGLWIK